MSADNWRTCPKCLARSRAEQELAIQRAEKKYGKVPATEFYEALTRAKELIMLNDTLRENYGIFVNENGKFIVNYRASCINCDFSFEFKHAQEALKK